MNNWTQRFSLPREPVDERIFDTVVTTHGRAVATWFITTYHDEIARSSDGLIEFVLRWTQSPASLETVWDLAFGRVQVTLKFGRLDPGSLAVQLALRLTESGHPGTWRATMRPATIRLGPMFLRSVEEVCVHDAAGAVHVVLRTADGAQRNVVRDAETNAWLAEGMQSLGSVGVNRRIYLLSGEMFIDDTEDR